MESNLALNNLCRHHSHKLCCFDLVVLAKEKTWDTLSQHFVFTYVGSFYTVPTKYTVCWEFLVGWLFYHLALAWWILFRIPIALICITCPAVFVLQEIVLT